MSGIVGVKDFIKSLMKSLPSPHNIKSSLTKKQYRFFVPFLTKVIVKIIMKMSKDDQTFIPTILFSVGPI